MKGDIAKSILETYSNQDPPDRFLSKNQSDGTWYGISHKKDTQKIMQALWERKNESKHDKDDG